MGYTTQAGAVISFTVDGTEVSRRQIDGIAQSFGNLGNVIQSSMRNAVAAVGVTTSVVQLAQVSDQYTKFTAQLRLATDSQREYAAAYDIVRRISRESQQDIGATGVLYARIAQGTRELGLSQQRVAAITEVVNLGLKVSGATAQESASAQLQLSQAFASGTLRGEEFNAVNEAAPAIMQALADGMGVARGQLKGMAEDGLLTAQVMADALPKSLGQLRDEAAQIQTIGGAVTQLRNEFTEFIGTQAEASGAVTVVTGSINALANHLGIVTGVVLTLTASKLGSWLEHSAKKTLETVAANRALALSELEAAKASAAATGSAVAVANARLNEVRASALAASGEVQLAIATNGVIPAQFRAAAAGDAHTLALNRLSAAQRAASLTSAASSMALAALGGPVGAVITVLGLAATAWSWYSSKSEEANATAANETKKSTYEIIGEINKQNEKLRERIELGKQAGMVEVAQQGGEQAAELAALLTDINALKAKGNSLDAAGQVELITKQGIYDELKRSISTTVTLEGGLKDLTQSTDIAEWFGRNGTAAQRMAFELDGLRKKFGTLPPEMEKIVKAKYKDPGVKAVNDELEKQARLIAEIRGLQPDYQENLQRLNRLYSTGKITLAEFTEANAKLADSQPVNKKLAEEAEALKNAIQSMAATGYDQVSSVEAQLAAQREQNAMIGLTEAQIVELNAKRLESEAASDREFASGVRNAAFLAGPYSEAYIKLAEDMERAAAAKDMLAAEKRTGFAKQSAASAPDLGVAAARDMLDIMSEVDDAARSAAQGMEQSFGRVGSAIGGLTTALSGYGRNQAAIAAQLAVATEKAGKDPAKIAKLTTEAARQSAQAQLQAYGDMAGAAKNFFDENSTGYRVMEGVEKSYRALEMAMAVESMLTKSGLLTSFTGLFVASKATESATETAATGLSVTNAGAQSSAWGVTAVVKAIASMPFPLNLAAGAATLAAVLAIGAKVVGGLGGGGANLAADRQAAAGTGSVFGDSSAKSESIAKSLDLLEKNSGIELSHTGGMLRALLSIENNIGGLSNTVVRSMGLDGTDRISGVSGNNSYGVKLGGMALGAAGGAALGYGVSLVGSVLGPVGAVVGAVVGYLVSKFSKVKTELIDQGIDLNRGSLGEMAQGVSGRSYADVKVKKSFLGITYSNNSSRDYNTLAPDVQRQFTQVISSLRTGIVEAVTVMGEGGDDFISRLDAIAVDIPDISLKGMSGEKIQETLNNVFGKLADDLASSATTRIPFAFTLNQFQQVGEGAFETLTRLATNYANVNALMEGIGRSFGATGYASLEARERLIQLAGGIDKLAEQTQTFSAEFLNEAERLAPIQKYVTEQMAALGYAEVKTRDQFKQLVLGLDVTTEAGAKQYAALMGLADAFAKVTVAAENTQRSAEDIANERKSLQDQLNQLTMTSAQLREKERNVLDESNRALFDRINAINDERAAIEAAQTVAAGLLSDADAAYATLQTVVGREKNLLTEAHDQRMKELQAEIDAHTKVMGERKALGDLLTGTLANMKLQGSESAERSMAQAQIRTALALAKAGGVLPDAESLRKSLGIVSQDASSMFATYEDYARDFYQTQNDIAELSKINDIALTVEEETLELLKDQKKLAEELYQEEMKRLDGIVSRAGEQLAELKGQSTTLLSIDQALQAFLGTISAALNNPLAAGAGQITSTYQSALGRAPDAAGMKFWQDRLAEGVSQSEIDKAIKNSPEAQAQKLYQQLLGRSGDTGGIKFWTEQLASGVSLGAASAAIMRSDEYRKRMLPGFAIGANYIPEDMPAMVHAGERIIPAADNRELMRRLSSPADNSAALVREVEKLREENARMRVMMEAHLYAIAKNTLNTADHLDGAANGEKPLKTEAA